MTITFEHENPTGAQVVFVLALAYKWLVGYTVNADGELQPDYARGEYTSITETTDKRFSLEILALPGSTALIQVCARSAEGRYDEECPL